MVGVAGSHGKTTVSWLICGILEAMEQITGESSLVLRTPSFILIIVYVSIIQIVVNQNHSSIWRPKTLFLIAGTLNSIGYSLSGELLDIDGDLWQPPEDDPAETQESSAPFRITSYHPGEVPPPYTSLAMCLDMVLC